MNSNKVLIGSLLVLCFLVPFVLMIVGFSLAIVSYWNLEDDLQVLSIVLFFSGCSLLIGSICGICLTLEVEK